MVGSEGYCADLLPVRRKGLVVFVYSRYVMHVTIGSRWVRIRCAMRVILLLTDCSKEALIIDKFGEYKSLRVPTRNLLPLLYSPMLAMFTFAASNLSIFDPIGAHRIIVRETTEGFHGSASED